MKKIRSDGHRTRKRIIQAATPLFAQAGPDRVSMRTIAKASGVALTTISYHFGSKAGLYRLAVTTAIRDGVDYEKVFEPATQADYADKQSVADALFTIIRNLAVELSQAESTQHCDLICQALFGHDPLVQKALLDGFDHFEMPFLKFLDMAGIEYSQKDKAYWLVFVWSQLLFYVSAREFVVIDQKMPSIPPAFYDEIAWKTTHFLCMEFNLPDPDQQ